MTARPLSHSAPTPALNLYRPRPDPAQEAYRAERQAHWDNLAGQPRKAGQLYARRLRDVYQFLVPKGLKVLELGCSHGDLLAAVEPGEGVGVDFSAEMIRHAQNRHPALRFVQGDAHQLPFQETFDVIILSDLLNDLWDVQTVLEEVRRLSHPQTRVILNVYNRLWQPLLKAAQKLGLARTTLPQNWLGFEDVANLLHLAGFDIVRNWEEVLCPMPVPLVEPFCNKVLARTWPLKHLALSNFLVARPAIKDAPPVGDTVSVIVPARNEAGNIAAVFDRVPRMGALTEIVFIEGHSKDDTYQTIVREIAKHPDWTCQVHRQTGMGKGDAVRLGFDRAKGDVLMILDADLTMPPEDLPRFYNALRAGHGELINGVRLVYPMEKKAMRFLNFLGNKFFSSAFSWVLGQPIKDTLCGTKVLSKSHYQTIARGREYFGDFDPFGDFDLIFGAAKANMKIVDMPIRYRERTYGDTNISRWKHGWLLLRMVAKAARKLKFK